MILGRFASYVVYGGYFDPLQLQKKSCHALGSLTPNIYNLDLLNEVLNIDFSKEAAKNITGQSWI